MSGIALSDEQHAAVDSDAKAIVVNAGAGSGKTEVAARRVERLLSEAPGEEFRVLALSYTVKAAEELRERFAERLGDLARRVDTDTIHGFALDLLRRYGTRIGLPSEPEVLTRQEDRVELLTSWLDQVGVAVPKKPAATLADIDLARAQCESAFLLDEWTAALRARGAVDYPEMLERATELLESQAVTRQLERLYEHIVVDEAQNLTCAQYRLLALVVGDPGRERMSAFFVGDEKQSIVGFAGADRTLMGEFADIYSATRIELRTNFRSARRIVELGNRVAEELGHQGVVTQPHEYSAEGSIEITDAPSEREEGMAVAAWVEEIVHNGVPTGARASGEDGDTKPEEVAVLGRTARSLEATRDALDSAGIKTAVASTDAEWVTSPTARALIEVIALRSAPEHSSAWRRLAEISGLDDHQNYVDLQDALSSARDAGVQSLSDLAHADLDALLDGFSRLAPRDGEFDLEDDIHQIESAWKAFCDRTMVSDRTFGNFRMHIGRTQRGDPLEPGVRLLTVHKAQGREFRAVAVVGCNEGQFPDFRADSAEEQQAELRTFYVAVSRPSRMLLLTRATSRGTRYGDRATEASRFLRLAATA